MFSSYYVLVIDDVKVILFQITTKFICTNVQIKDCIPILL